MFEYVKTILSKVSFDDELFSREYRKALAQLDADDVVKLRLWVSSNFDFQPADQVKSNVTTE